MGDKDFKNLLIEAVGFHTGRISVEDFSEEKILRLFGRYHPVYSYENRSFVNSPKYIRVGQDEKFKSLNEILLDQVINQSDIPFVWIEDISYSTEIVRPLVENCSNYSEDALINLMALFGKLHFSRIGNGRSLTIQNTKKILKIARLSDDPLVLSGVSIALSTSKFIKSAGCELIGKLLKSTKNSKRISDMLFKTHSIFPDSLEEKESEIIENLADLIMSNPSDYSIKINCAAAKFLSERRIIKLQPLLIEEEALGLTLRVAN